MNRDALLSQSVWTVPPICRLEESFGNTSSKISINTCDVASFVNITGMELMIKANVRLDTHSCFRTKKKKKQNPTRFPTKGRCIKQQWRAWSTCLCSRQLSGFNSAAPWFSALTLRAARPPEIIISTFRPSSIHFWSWLCKRCSLLSRSSKWISIEEWKGSSSIWKNKTHDTRHCRSAHCLSSIQSATWSLSRSYTQPKFKYRTN